MNKVLFFLLIVGVIACNKYEVLEPSVQIRIHTLNEDENQPYTGYMGIIRVSNFIANNSSPTFFEESESVRFDSAIVNNNGDLLFDVPFLNGSPQAYYELSLKKDGKIPISEGKFISQYVQHDTFRFRKDYFTQLDIKIRNDSCRNITFSTLGYRTRDDYKQDSINFFTNPDYVARFPTTDAKNTRISKVLPYYCNNVVVVQMLDRTVIPPLLVKFDIIEMVQDSIITHCVQL